MKNVVKKTATKKPVSKTAAKKTAVKTPALKYAVIRSRDQGVMCGYVKWVADRQVCLAEARQIYRYSSKFVLPEVAQYGMKDPSAAMLSCAMSEDMVMLEACGVLYCTDVAAAQLRSIPAQER